MDPNSILTLCFGERREEQTFLEKNIELILDKYRLEGHAFVNTRIILKKITFLVRCKKQCEGLSVNMAKQKEKDLCKTHVSKDPEIANKISDIILILF